MNSHGMRQVSDGVYEGEIAGVKVRVIRTKLGEHPIYHSHSKQPEWKVHANGRVISDGNGTMIGAIQNARRVLERK